MKNAIRSMRSALAKGFVKLVDVKDARPFEAAPRSPSVPSLQDPKEIGNPAITSRAIARKRGGFGNALADILLLKGDALVDSKDERVRGYAVVKGMIASDTEWQEVMKLGVADLVVKTKAVVKAAE